MTNQAHRVLLDIGELYVTRGVVAELDAEEVFTALQRHMTGDWGNVPAEDWKENDLSLENGDRILSSYVSGNAVKYWIITEADRSATTVLLPDEY